MTDAQDPRNPQDTRIDDPAAEREVRPERDPQREARDRQGQMQQQQPDGKKNRQQGEPPPPQSRQQG